MKNKLIKATILCITLAAVGLMFAGCANTATYSSAQVPYYATNNFLVGIKPDDDEDVKNNQEYITRIVYNSNHIAQVTSGTDNKKEIKFNDVDFVTIPEDSIAYDAEIKFTYFGDEYHIKPVVNKQTKKIEGFNLLKNGEYSQQLSWDGDNN